MRLERLAFFASALAGLEVAMVTLTLAVAHSLAVADVTRNSSGDEIANVNFLYDDIVYTRYKIQ